MRRLILIRHGQTEGNVRRWYYGALDLPLTQAGAQALTEGARQGRYPACGGFLVVTSGMLRTEQTLRCICGETPHEQRRELREVSFGIFEGKTYEELAGTRAYEAWLAGDWFANVPPGGESFRQAETRIRAGLAQMLAQERDIFAVVHGGTILTIMQTLFPEEERSGYDWQPAPGGGYDIDLTKHTYRGIGLEKTL